MKLYIQFAQIDQQIDSTNFHTHLNSWVCKWFDISFSFIVALCSPFTSPARRPSNKFDKLRFCSHIIFTSNDILYFFCEWFFPWSVCRRRINSDLTKIMDCQTVSVSGYNMIFNEKTLISAFASLHSNEIEILKMFAYLEVVCMWCARYE